MPQLQTIAEQLILPEQITGGQFRDLLDGKAPEEVFAKGAEEPPAEEPEKTETASAEEAAAEPASEEEI